MLPLSLLKTAQAHPVVSILRECTVLRRAPDAAPPSRAVTEARSTPRRPLVASLTTNPTPNQTTKRKLIELKNGETYNGHVVTCDSWMNVHLREVICTSRDGDRFFRMAEAYVRGNTIKYVRVPDEVVEKVKEEQANRKGALCVRARV